VRREPIAGVADIDLRQGHLPIHVQELTVRRDLAPPRGGEPRNVIESSAVVQRTRAGSAETTVAISDPSARKASTRCALRQPGHRRCGRAPGEQRPDLLHAGERGEPPFGPSIQSVA
jgi:hypothetical protein